jgi:S-adenosylmethionine-diacylglycerol 3-amino-3-carboxypropyl transferase
MFMADKVERQRELYYGFIRNAIWTPIMRRLICTDFALYLAGVPKAQREQVERHFPGGVAQLMDQCLDAVFAELPLRDNYFWWVYFAGGNSRHCCPEYLKEENFARLKEGLVDRITVATDTVEGYLRKHPGRISRFVLLDHMDWLASHRQDWLQSEWQAIVDKAAPNARVLFRSGGVRVDYVDPLVVKTPGGLRRVGEMLRYNHDLAAELHARDRVHMYGCFHIADFAVA